MPSIFAKTKKLFTSFGPGIVTGAADDDPSGIATYTQTGAQFGFGQLWTALLMLPFMMAVQEAVARIGAVNGKGIAAVIRQYYSKKVLFAIVSLVLIANTINIGADIGAMAAALQLIIPLNFTILTLSFTVIILLLEIFLSYKKYARILKYAALTLLAYPITFLLVEHNWHELFIATFVPHIELNFQFFFIITGVLGTTISPYMFFWQASQEVEEERAHHMLQKNAKPKITKRFMHLLRVDNAVGMIASEITTWCIIVVAATVLHKNGLTNVATAADAARALEPLVHTFPHAGFLAKAIFATGVIGLGFLGIPVLSGSAAYAFAEAANWRDGLNLKFRRAHGFYGVVTIATLIGLLINYVGIDPIKALVFTAVFNGVAAVPLVFLIAKIARSEKIMGEYRSKWLSNILVWTTFVAMGAAAVIMFVSGGG